MKPCADDTSIDRGEIGGKVSSAQGFKNASIWLQKLYGCI